MRGSRFAGLLSMRKTTVPGSGCEPWQPASASRAASARSLRIGYLPKNYWTTCSCCRRHIAGPVMPGLPCEESKGRRFLGFRGQAKVLAGSQVAAKRLKLLRQHGHQRPVARASARDNVVDSIAVLHLWLAELLVALHNGFRGECGSGGQCIFGPGTGKLAVSKKLRGVLASKLFPSGRARWLESEIGIAQRPCQDRSEDLSICGNGAIPV